MLSSQAEAVVQRPFREVQEHVATKAQKMASKLVHAEHHHTKEGELALLVGISRPMRASGILPVLMQGVRHSMFFIRVREATDGVHVMAIVGGAETWTQFDFGRNRNLVDFLLDGLVD